MDKKSADRFFHTSELIIITAGVLFLGNVVVAMRTGDMTLWFAAALLYVVGATLFLFNR